MPRLRAAMTLVEVLVSITIFLTLITIVTMVHHNVGQSVNRTLSLLQIHHEGNAIVRRLREDLTSLAPQVVMKSDEHHQEDDHHQHAQVRLQAHPPGHL